MKENYKHNDKVFWITEAALLAVFLFLFYVAVGYNTIALVLFAITALIGIYRILSYLGKKSVKAAKILKIVLTTLVCLGLALFTIIEIIVISTAHTDKNPEAPYLIVLGAGVNGTVPSYSLYYRLEAAKQYLEDYPETVAVVSGGQGPGEDITEAECMRRWLTENGIPENRLLMEQKSTSTYENLKYSFDIIRKNGGDTTRKIAILSEEFHLYRAKYYAKELGADAVVVAAHTGQYHLKVNYFIREAFGVAYMWILEGYLGHS